MSAVSVSLNGVCYLLTEILLLCPRYQNIYQSGHHVQEIKPLFSKFDQRGLCLKKQDLFLFSSSSFQRERKIRRDLLLEMKYCWKQKVRKTCFVPLRTVLAREAKHAKRTCDMFGESKNPLLGLFPKIDIKRIRVTGTWFQTWSPGTDFATPQFFCSLWHVFTIPLP